MLQWAKSWENHELIECAVSLTDLHLPEHISQRFGCWLHQLCVKSSTDRQRLCSYELEIPWVLLEEIQRLNGKTFINVTLKIVLMNILDGAHDASVLSDALRQRGHQETESWPQSRLAPPSPDSCSALSPACRHIYTGPGVDRWLRASHWQPVQRLSAWPQHAPSQHKGLHTTQINKQWTSDLLWSSYGSSKPCHFAFTFCKVHGTSKNEGSKFSNAETCSSDTRLNGL